MCETKDLENTLILETTKGRVVIELLADLAPGHVARIKEFVREGAYDNVVFHRVIEGFMAQTGDVQFGKKDSEKFNLSHVGMGGSEKPNLTSEFSNIPHKRGTVSMARSQDPNSANSQFFICFTDAPWLDRQYSIWGRVIDGMENIDQIKRGEPVVDPDVIIKATIAADTK
ncbi:peptidylprolyl isomerase [Bartonella rattaustraliani]|uniref:peptidylprolyl isomerase n=1 Tax=Bartonella rattaustraliani TaxID=481139 RepID=UPI0002FA76D4|nr:peptidylprolyl isomerase [Bartonella rattaustraliani]